MWDGSGGGGRGSLFKGWADAKDWAERITWKDPSAVRRYDRFGVDAILNCHSGLHFVLPLQDSGTTRSDGLKYTADRRRCGNCGTCPDLNSLEYSIARGTLREMP